MEESDLIILFQSRHWPRSNWSVKNSTLVTPFAWLKINRRKKSFRLRIAGIRQAAAQAHKTGIVIHLPLDKMLAKES